ncbi:MAG: hypothetical protein EAZ97_14805 [Bacteroidetes bacterium]|nr:MAG: hypothetical protein EAZ97_14805 [Bacteroidota bacterium]
MPYVIVLTIFCLFATEMRYYQGERIKVKSGKTVEVEMNTYADTTYNWTIFEKPDAKIIKLVEEKPNGLNKKKQIKHIFVFKGLKKGKTEFLLRRVRNGKIEKTDSKHRYKVVVE